MLGEFRPTFVVVDEGMLGAGKSDLLDCLAHETRVPGLKVILAASRREALPGTGDENAFDGFIKKPFDYLETSDRGLHAEGAPEAYERE